MAVNELLDPADDLPPPPLSYNEYVERKFRDAIREAYTRGFERGCRHQLAVLLFGIVVGCVLGFCAAITNQ